jgi:hypothetical protein
MFPSVVASVVPTSLPVQGSNHRAVKVPAGQSDSFKD